MKKLLLMLTMPLVLASCGGGEDDKKGGTLDLSEHGLEATIEAGEPKKVSAVDFSTNYELKVLKQVIDIEYDDNLVLMISEAPGNEVKAKVEKAEKWGGEVLESSDNHFLIKEKGFKDEITYLAAYYYEKDGVWFVVKVADAEKYFHCTSEEQAKKGMEIAKTFKFK